MADEEQKGIRLIGDGWAKVLPPSEKIRCVNFGTMTDENKEVYRRIKGRNFIIHPDKQEVWIYE